MVMGLQYRLKTSLRGLFTHSGCNRQRALPQDKCVSQEYRDRVGTQLHDKRPGVTCQCNTRVLTCHELNCSTVAVAGCFFEVKFSFLRLRGKSLTRRRKSTRFKTLLHTILVAVWWNGKLSLILSGVQRR